MVTKETSRNEVLRLEGNLEENYFVAYDSKGKIVRKNINPRELQPIHCPKLISPVIGSPLTLRTLATRVNESHGFTADAFIPLYRNRSERTYWIQFYNLQSSHKLH